MKTKKQWYKSNKNLDEYLTEPCEIDQELYNYLGEAVSPQYCDSGFVQLGEADHSDSYGTYYYMTASCIDCRYFYLGILPEFKQ